jgi:uncharacterized membrane protein YdbT with pleckstrin-like domain
MSTMFQSFLSEATAKGAKSTALHSLQWMLGILLSALPMTIWAGGPSWILIGIGSSALVILVLFVFAYLYFLFKQPDALRSEQFTLSKLAIEKGLVGDSNTGFVQISETRHISNTSIPAPINSDQDER